MNLFKRLANILFKVQSERATIDERLEGRRIQRAIQKKALIRQGRIDALALKRRRIEQSQGRHGRSMSPELLRRHGIHSNPFNAA